jgi:hypothetical protein
MKPHLRRCIATITIALVAAWGLAGCSKPIDPDSSVPAVYQPLVFVAAAVGVGILLTSHTHSSTSGGTTPPPPVTAPVFVGALGNQPFDISLDLSTAGFGGVGALGKAGGGGRYSFLEVESPGPDNGSYALPTGYTPIAVAIDGDGNDWFVDSTGLVDKCPAPVSGVTTCTPSLSFNDGLGSSGVRTIAADSARVFIADDLSGTVSWVAYALDGTGKTTGSYTYTGLGIYNADAAVATLGAAAIYTIFHKDGTSWKVALPTSSKNPYTFTPVPLAGQNMASDGLGNNYGFLGSASSSYQMGHYVSTGNAAAAPGTLVSTITISFNGQTGLSPLGLGFTPPVRSAHYDGTFLEMLDSSGNLVVFQGF